MNDNIDKPPFLICKESKEIPGCETILDTQSLDLARIVRLESPEAYRAYIDAHSAHGQVIHAKVPGHRIVIESLLNLSTINMIGNYILIYPI